MATQLWLDNQAHILLREKQRLLDELGKYRDTRTCQAMHVQPQRCEQLDMMYHLQLPVGGGGIMASLVICLLEWGLVTGLHGISHSLGTSSTDNVMWGSSCTDDLLWGTSCTDDVMWGYILY